MKPSEQMLLDCGFKYEPAFSENHETYTRPAENGWEELCFFDTDRTYTFSYETELYCFPAHIDMDVAAAIHQHLLELGWI